MWYPRSSIDYLTSGSFLSFSRNWPSILKKVSRMAMKMVVENDHILY